MSSQKSVLKSVAGVGEKAGLAAGAGKRLQVLKAAAPAFHKASLADHQLNRDTPAWPGEAEAKRS